MSTADESGFELLPAAAVCSITPASLAEAMMDFESTAHREMFRMILDVEQCLHQLQKAMDDMKEQFEERFASLAMGSAGKTKKKPEKAKQPRTGTQKLASPKARGKKTKRSPEKAAIASSSKPKQKPARGEKAGGNADLPKKSPVVRKSFAHLLPPEQQGFADSPMGVNL